MDTFWKAILWRQFGAAIDMLANAMRSCPEDVWAKDPAKRPEWIDNDVVGFWYVAYHTIFFLDYYLSVQPEGFVPPAPFTRAELDPAGLLPERPYTKAELQSYLGHCRGKCRAMLDAISDEDFRKASAFSRFGFSRAEMLLYNLRHVQHHAAQLNLLLRQQTGGAPGWVSEAADSLSDA
jgi:hypothetical protein